MYCEKTKQEFTDDEIANEEWRPVPGYEQIVEVSNIGRVRNVARTVECTAPQGGRYTMEVPAVVRAQSLSGERRNYHGVNIRVEGSEKRLSVHRIVLEAFVGPCPSGMECCHNDGDTHNNRVGNLRWDTPTNNHADKIVHGTLRRGESHYQGKLTRADVLDMRAKDAAGDSVNEIAQATGFNRATVYDVVKRKTWKHV